MGAHYRGGVYGTDVNLPIVNDEANGKPNFKGCTDLKAYDSRLLEKAKGPDEGPFVLSCGNSTHAIASFSRRESAKATRYVINAMTYSALMPNAIELYSSTPPTIAPKRSYASASWHRPDVKEGREDQRREKHG